MRARMLLATTAASLVLLVATWLAGAAAPQQVDFPHSAATPSETCGACHQAIYQEFARGVGSNLHYRSTTLHSASEPRLTLPAGAASTATAHAYAGVDPFPIHARQAEEENRSCNVCHFPQPFALPDIATTAMAKPSPRPRDQEAGGVTCASCHLTPDGRIRGPYQVDAPHQTVAEPAMQTSAMCAYCHSLGKRIPGKQTQTFLEWREDFAGPGLGRQQCQDCHMPRTVRKLAEAFNAPPRTVARHFWTGGHSLQRLRSALNLVVEQPEEGKAALAFHIINIGACHSVPTGSNRRAVYLIATVTDQHNKPVAAHEWMFAPWYGDRPDDRAFLQADKQRKDVVAATQADAQGPHEPPIRAGEERLLPWTPALQPGDYVVRSRLVYDLNRYNDRSFTDDQTEIYQAAVPLRFRRGGTGSE